MQTILLILCILICIIAIVQIFLILKLMKKTNSPDFDNQEIKQEISRLTTSLDTSQKLSGQSFEKMADLLRNEQKNAFSVQNENLSRIEQQTIQHLADARQVSESLSRQTEERMRSFSQENEQRLSKIETTVAKYLTMIQTAIDQEMQEMLETRLNQGFQAQTEKMSLIEKQTAQHLADAKEASESLSRQTEERMRSFSQENEQRLSKIETTVAKYLTMIQTVIDQEMQEMLETRLNHGFQAQTEKMSLIEKQTAQHLADAKEASESLSRQTEERMRSFSQENEQRLSKIETTIQTNLDQIRDVINIKMQQTLDKRLAESFQIQSERLNMIQKQTENHLSATKQASESLSRQTEERMRSFSQENAQKLTQIEINVQKVLSDMRTDQNTQLDQMRAIVDEKMQKVLNERMNQAFSTVNERLEQVHKGLGEMQTLAGNVGDLKKLLSNVKTRGEIGEIQLETLLSDMLSESQYIKNAKFGTKIVEFAIVIPAAQGENILLPIDSKFPGDTYMHLQDAYDANDETLIRMEQKNLADRIRSEAKDIKDKYINPPQTTDFGILFLPTEGLYSEAIRAGLMEELFRKYHVFLTGPSTLSALLSTLQIGFRNIAIQKRSDDVQRILEEVKTEFSTFADALASTQKKLDTASKELENLVGRRTRAMNRKLENVQNYLTEDSSADN